MPAKLQATSDSSGDANTESGYRVEIELAENDGIARHQETVMVGVPLTQARVKTAAELSLCHSGGKPLEHYYFKEVAHWPDGSLKWVHLFFSATIGANEKQSLIVEKQLATEVAGNVTRLDAKSSGGIAETGIRGHAANAARLGDVENSPSVGELQDRKSVRLASVHNCLAVDRDENRFEIFSSQGTLICAAEMRCKLDLPEATGQKDQSATSPKLERAESDTLSIKKLTLLESNPIFSSVALQYDCCYPNTENGKKVLALSVELVLSLHHASGALQQTITLHNPGAARHPAGFWDMGGAGSVLLKQFELVFLLNQRDGCELSLSADPAGDAATDLSFERATSFKIYQESSGGDNWQSPVHVNRDNKVPMQQQGYKIEVNGSEQNAGARAEPIVFCPAKDAGFGIFYSHFWQAFPSSLGVDGSVLTVGLLPGDFPDQHELQGGEKLRKELWIQTGQSLDNLRGARRPLLPVVAASHWHKVPHLLFFQESEFATRSVPQSATQSATRESAQTTSHPLQPLIEPSLQGAHSFFEKRETYDEFGWRNYGELFADHESWSLDQGFNVSHYNNQYDPIYSFGLQFLLTGDRRWFELMNDLACHVVHIDLYNTDQDRPDFNGGMFWHTDHYMDAHTATHRAHSIHQCDSVGKAEGGGFSTEHCYTNGLALHYFLTGNRASRQAVLNMTDWVLRLENGDKTIVDTLKKVVRNELTCIKELAKQGESTGYIHEFNRGTGNIIATLVSAYEITGNTERLDMAEKIIRESIHYRDDIEKRELLNAETRWSYTVLLHAMTRYLAIKELEGSLDAEYWYAREAFISYSRWMLEHEMPYLDNPDGLQHVNNTWAAQDARKCYLLQQAAFYDPGYEMEYLQKSEHIMAHVLEQLSDSPQLSYTRIQVLLLQSFCRTKVLRQDAQEIRMATHEFDLGSPPAPNIVQQCVRGATKILGAIVKVSPAREFHWLKSQYKLNR